VKVIDVGDRALAIGEGQALAELDHPNVVTIHSHGTRPDYRYFVLQLLEGPDLRTWWRDKTPAETIAKFMEAASGLVAVHAKGLVHHDFKPSNVRIGPKGQAVVVDFGLARRVATLEPDEAQVDTFVGTLDYAAPERLLGEPGDERSDQFSFCVALWDALSGVNPFGACTASMDATDRARAILAGVAGTPRGGRRVERALRRGLSPHPGDRFPTMQALMVAIAPRAWRSTWGARLVGVVAVVLVVGSLTQIVPRAGSSTKFVPTAGFAELIEPAGAYVADARAKWAGAIAVGLAHAGDTSGALQSLESTKPAERNEEASRGLALASGEVAAEFERQRIYHDALYARGLAIRFARDAGDSELEQQARDRFDALATAIYSNSAL
jgi:hypothetical protein